MNQERLKLAFGVTEAPKAVPTEVVKKAKSYREACRYQLKLSRIQVSYRVLAEVCKFIYQHTGDYFNSDDKPKRRNLPVEKIPDLEWFTGNTFLSQWIAMQSGLTVIEEVQANIQAQRSAA